METTLVRQEGLDKFYTIPNIVDMCLQSVVEEVGQWGQWDLIVEPSAGNGSFFLKLPPENTVGIDISPDHPDIVKQDFFAFLPLPLLEKENKNETLFCPLLKKEVEKRILVIGNPPFGKISSTAIKFFNHAATFSTVIAFIVPRTFRRLSVQNKLDPRFHIVLDKEIPISPCSFVPPMSAKCCFQIWEKRSQLRTLVKLSTKHPDWNFLGYGEKDDKGQPTPPSGADFAIRAYGGKCGEVKKDNIHLLHSKSFHWIQCNGKVSKDLLMHRFSQLDYSMSQNTARQNSIGRGELVLLYSDFLDAEG